jgi:hypothetical protein
MSALDDHYRQQPAHEWIRAEQAAIHEWAEEQGISYRQAEYERQRADREWREADQARVRALLSDPTMLRALRAQQTPRPIQPDGAYAPLPALPTFVPIDSGEESTPPSPERPPSAGRSISPGR